MGYRVFILRAFLARTLFAIHGAITFKRVTDIYSETIYIYLLVIPVCFVIPEMILTLKVTENGEWKWVCPSVLLYLASTVPGLWLLQLDLYNKRIAHRDFMGLEECSKDITYDTTSLNSNMARIPVGISDLFSDDDWILTLEQVLVALLVLGRWLLPKGSLTRDQLSELLLVYIGMAAEILEFPLDSLKEQGVMCNFSLIILILALWTWSLLQFTLVLTSVSAPRPRAAKISRVKSCKGCLGCCENEIWALCVAILMQDGPFLGIRLYLLIHLRVINQMMIFFTLKNALMIVLQLYRLSIMCCGDTNSVSPETQGEAFQVIQNESAN